MKDINRQITDESIFILSLIFKNRAKRDFRVISSYVSIEHCTKKQRALIQNVLFKKNYYDHAKKSKI